MLKIFEKQFYKIASFLHFCLGKIEKARVENSQTSHFITEAL